jgi:aldehyde:ferredoxin oxidoreductase
VKDGDYKGACCVGPEYFTIVSFGSKPGVNNPASIIKANELCNIYGLDTASTGGIIAFTMECYEKGLLTKEQVDGLDLSWGNYKSMLTLIELIAFRKGFGDILAKGIKAASKHIGEESERYAIHVKGMDAVTLDPRAVKVYNFRYAVASRGADHLRISCPAAYHFDPLPIKEAAKQLKYWQDIVCIPDMMGICKIPWNFNSGSTDIIKTKLFKIVPELYSAATGWEVTANDLLIVSERIAATERATNIKLGLQKTDDCLPRRFREDPLPEGPKKGQVHDIFEPLLDAWYDIHGWTIKNGIPEKKRLEKLGLHDIAEKLDPIYNKMEG